MIIKTAEYLMSNIDYKKCPDNDIYEFAFIGRSNVGKSSLINMLTGNKSLAKISSKPGKTQKINHFIINKSWYLVDLPGYGFAKISKTMREVFSKMTVDYILHRRNLACLFVLIDSRIPPQKIDIEYMEWLGNSNVPFAIVFTKIDKPGTNALRSNIEVYKNELLKTWETLPEVFLSSAEEGTGKDEILNYIESIINSGNK
ncbi:MAG: ribosome biogenesis GTP-binding protein YihA/YsxC [Bacteroidales bacterium]|jgi:GTP-binding protein|nr:ribosome biogenesis GTP-binding protein YihA/YsxC [Bacteroidales bacterium]